MCSSAVQPARLLDHEILPNKQSMSLSKNHLASRGPNLVVDGTVTPQEGSNSKPCVEADDQFNEVLKINYTTTSEHIYF